jgi:ABC-type phosphate/phosphonate transport system ATPase subunit
MVHLFLFSQHAGSQAFSSLPVFVAGATALSGVNLQLQPGRLVALVGLSGSGKAS